VHVVHVACGLEVMVAGIEADALAEQHHGLLGLGMAVAQIHDGGIIVLTALRYRDESPRPILRSFFMSNSSTFQPCSCASFFTRVRQGPSVSSLGGTTVSMRHILGLCFSLRQRHQQMPTWQGGRRGLGECELC